MPTSALMTDASQQAESVSAEQLPSSHRVVKDANGRLRIPGVPIFVEHTRVMNGTPLHFGLSWIKQAALNMKTRAEGQSYRPAVHLGHHDPATKAERPSVGVFEDPKIRRAIYDGKPAWVLFSDVVLDGVKDLQRVLKHRYRSVEINNLWGEPKIDGLALLQSRSPYFKFPNLELETSSVGLAYEADPGQGGAFFWPTPLELQFAEQTPMGNYDQGNGSAPPSGSGSGTGSDADKGKDAAPGWAQQLVSMMQKLLSVFDVPAAQPGAAGAPPVVQAAATATAPLRAEESTVNQDEKLKIEKKLEKAKKKLAQIAKASADPANGAVSYAEPIEKLSKKIKKLAKAFETASASPAPAQTPAPRAPISFAEPVVAFAKKALEQSQIKVKAREECLQWAEQQLSDRPTGDLAEMRTILSAQYDAGGKPAVEGAVKTLQAMLPSLPGPHAHADAKFTAASSEAPEVLAYSDDADAFEIAKGIKQLWANRHPNHADHTLASWLDAEPELVGKKRPAPAGAKG